MRSGLVNEHVPSVHDGRKAVCRPTDRLLLPVNMVTAGCRALLGRLALVERAMFTVLQKT